MKVVLFDTGHFETAYTLIRLFDVPGNEVIIFTNGQTESILKDMLQDEQDRYNWFIIDRWISDWNYFFYTRKQLAYLRPDFIYLNTIDRQPFYYALLLNVLPQTRVILTIHDINFFFHRGRFPEIREVLSWAGRKMLLREVEGLNVISETMLAHLQKKVNNRIPLFQIPGAVFEQDNQVLYGTVRIRLVVPGSIDQKRRNYDDVFLLCELMEEAALPVDITLLGGYVNNYGKAVIAKAKQWQGEHTSIAAYNGSLIPQTEYDRVIRQAHFLFSPMEVHTKIYGDIQEIYGITKSSGTISDAVRHAKPLILPDAFRISTHLQSSCFRYKTLNEITDLIYKLFREPLAYNIWQENALRNARWYTITQVRERNLTLFFANE